MGLFSAITAALDEDDEGAGEDDDTFSYVCASCGAEFDLPKTRMIGVRCPECRSMDVRDAGEA